MDLQVKGCPDPNIERRAALQRITPAYPQFLGDFVMKIESKMAMKKLSRVAAAALVGLTSLATTIGSAIATPQPTIPSVGLIGLTPNNTLILFRSNSPSSNSNSNRVKVTGIDGFLQGIDFRPADGKLYGVTDTDKIYTINPNTGAAKLVSKLSISFDGGFQSGVDFNPALDALRLVGSNDQNYSVKVDTGVVTAQTTIAYASGDPNQGKDPNLTAAAYTNAQAGPPNAPAPATPTRTTQLFDIDYDRDVLVLQNPPPTGQLATVGNGLGVNFAPTAGFDIFTDAKGVNTGFAVSGSTLYTIDLIKGTARRVGDVPNGSGFIGLAVPLASQGGS